MITPTPGPLLFARFAYPPNAMGFCGPDDPAALMDHTSAGESGADLSAQAARFAGAWPYLQLIAASTGRADPLDSGVVEAYWLGNGLLGHVPPAIFAAHLAARFEARAGRGIADLATLALLGAVPHHNFHVFAVYPWVGMLRAGRAAEEPMRVLNACRIRWGRVRAVEHGVAEVLSAPLEWTGTRLQLAPPRPEHVLCATDRGSLTPTVQAGDVVAMHWDWVCDVISAARVRALRAFTADILHLTNEALERPVASAILD